MSKRGRPRSDRPRIDTGTPELIHKRLMASPQDPTLSTTPLDVLKARNIISDEAHGAATYFAALHKITFGKPHIQAVDMNAVSGSSVDMDEERTAEKQALYMDACRAMRSYSRTAFDAVENVAVHQRFPSWLIEPGGMGSGRQYQNFCLGIAALLGWYKASTRRAA